MLPLIADLTGVLAEFSRKVVQTDAASSTAAAMVLDPWRDPDHLYSTGSLRDHQKSPELLFDPHAERPLCLSGTALPHLQSAERSSTANAVVLDSWLATYTILAFLWHNTGKEGPAAAPPGTASFGFGEFVVTVVRRAKTYPSGVSPSPRGTVVAPEGALDVHPAPARDMHCDDSSSDQHKTSAPDTEPAGSDASQEATVFSCHPQLALVVASKIEAQKGADNEDVDNAHADPAEVPDTRTSAVPDEVTDAMTNAAPGSCTGIVQGNNGAPMRVPGSGLQATSGKVGFAGGWAVSVMEGAQQRKPVFGFSTPANEMLSTFWNLPECQELGDMEPCSLSHSNRLSVSKLRTSVQSKAALAAAMQVDFTCSRKHSSKVCRYNQKIAKLYNLAQQASRRAGVSSGR
ncbi:TPA: hypothetical protein ACH3X1_006356 [Trebouxia sp. C0004]